MPDEKVADYKVDSIADVRVADDPSSVRVAVVAGAEQVVLTIDWRKASDLIDRMAEANHQIRHSLSVPDWRAQRVRAGCHRTGVGIAALLSLPIVYGLWLWVIGDLDPQAWRLVGWFLLAAPLAYGVIWLIGWIVAGFVGKRERDVAEAEKRAAAEPEQRSAEPQLSA
jgi:hypothetical protein